MTVGLKPVALPEGVGIYDSQTVKFSIIGVEGANFFNSTKRGKERREGKKRERR